jgi:hypothetical protein
VIITLDRLVEIGKLTLEIEEIRYTLAHKRDKRSKLIEDRQKI